MTPPKIWMPNFIDGNWLASASGRTFENVNPANYVTIWSGISKNQDLRTWMLP